METKCHRFKVKLINGWPVVDKNNIPVTEPCNHGFNGFKNCQVHAPSIYVMAQLMNLGLVSASDYIQIRENG